MIHGLYIIIRAVEQAPMVGNNLDALLVVHIHLDILSVGLCLHDTIGTDYVIVTSKEQKAKSNQSNEE